MEPIEEKLNKFRERLLDKDYPLALDEILGEIQYLYEDDKEVFKVIVFQKSYNEKASTSLHLYPLHCRNVGV